MTTGIDQSFEPEPAESPTAHMLDELALCGYRPFADEADGRPLPEARIAAGSYGTCVDCEEPIPHPRLAAYPTAKRCLRCQQIRETARASAGRR